MLCRNVDVPEESLEQVLGEDRSRSSIKGFGLDECVPLSKNTFLLPDASDVVRWDGERSMRELVGKRLRLVFELDRAHLYSFRAGDSK